MGSYPVCLTACHCAQDSATDCPTALKSYIGLTLLSLTFTRVPWDESLARWVESKNKYKINTSASGADLIPVDVNQAGQGLNRYIVVYKYFERQSCESMECLQGNGWRKLFLFDSIYANIGTKDVNIGAVNYAVGNMSTFDFSVQHMQYYWFACKFELIVFVFNVRLK